MPPIKFQHQFIGLLILFCAASPGIAYSAPWLLIDTQMGEIHIMNGQQSIKKLEDISVGRGGVTDLHIKGDDTTPRGEFRIVRINHDSRFRRFFEINYPTIPHAEAAFRQKVIDEPTYWRIVKNQRSRGHSPQNTPLGGHLGIHGLGGGDPEFHEMFNWTNGCVALSNRQIDELSRWIGLGTKVVIK